MKNEHLAKRIINRNKHKKYRRAKPSAMDGPKQLHKTRLLIVCERQLSSDIVDECLKDIQAIDKEQHEKPTYLRQLMTDFRYSGS